MGFEYFYGFVGGDTSQWQPNLFRNTTPIYPYVGKPGWNLTTAMADDAIDWLNQLNQIDPEQAVLLLLRSRRHARAAPPDAGMDREDHDMHLFDKGWNKLREQIFANQKKLGVIPQDAKLTPWPEGAARRTGTQLHADEKKLFIRQVEVYAAYLAYTDHEIGRVIQAVEDMGKLDNTLIIYISGDNGSSAEGTLDRHAERSRHVQRRQSAGRGPAEVFYDVWGTDQTYNHMAVGWTWAFDTPFSWTKQIASHFGGTRQGMCDFLARPHQGRRRHPHTSSTTSSTSCRRSSKSAASTRPRSVDGIKQSADRRRELGLHLRRGQRQGAVRGTRRSTSR